ncbi:unnamed protein product [Dibothriocephalus latus]|uniref:Uncharacterized protein n=1 Tax=Dibothriocephalus latus TaxID=60516 RepID=A0A3P7NZ28_DIBLA|nr:unnamed protein product [Dibothriocephalus latus]
MSDDSRPKAGILVDYIGFTEKGTGKDGEKCNSNLQTNVQIKLNLPDGQKREYSTYTRTEVHPDSDLGGSLTPQINLKTELSLEEDSDSDATSIATPKSTLPTLLSSSLPTVLPMEHPVDRTFSALSSTEFAAHRYPCQLSSRGNSLPIFSDSDLSEACPIFRGKSVYLSDSNESLLSNALSAVQINTED